MVKYTNWQEANWAESVGYSTNMVEDLNSRLTRTNPASGTGGTWTRGLKVQRSNHSATLPPKNKSYEYQYITDSI